MPDGEGRDFVMIDAHTAQRAERRVKRLQKRAEQELPLFAQVGMAHEIAHVPTVDKAARELLAMARGVRVAHLRRLRTAITAWARWRAVAERYFSMEQIAHMEGYCRRVFPSRVYAPIYRAEYWHQLCRELGIEREG